MKKPFYKKWWVWLIAFIIIIKAFSSGTTETTTASSNAESKPQTKKQEIKIINVGEEEEAGKMGIKVLEAKEDTAISNESGKASSSGKFIIIKLELKNNGNEATEFDPHDFRLKENKKVYEVDDNAFEALGNLNSQETIYNENKNFIGSYDKFNSGITKQTYIVFDVPKESTLENLNLIVEHGKNIEFKLK